MTIQDWMPGVHVDDRGGCGPSVGPGPTVVVLHTTECKGPASYPGDEPHFEVNSDGTIRQFVPLTISSRALYHPSGTEETNRRRGHVIQIEQVWFAKDAADMPDALLQGTAKIIRFVKEQLGLDFRRPPQGFFKPGVTIASVDGALRFSPDEWEDFSGICGHVNVPENDHWDPGDFPWDRLVRFVGDSADTGKDASEEDSEPMQPIYAHVPPGEERSLKVPSAKAAIDYQVQERFASVYHYHDGTTVPVEVHCYGWKNPEVVNVAAGDGYVAHLPDQCVGVRVHNMGAVPVTLEVEAGKRRG